MIFIVTALPVEAAPLISHFGLKSVPSKGRFTIFESKTIQLIISGPGKVLSAIATTQLLTQQSAEVLRSAHILNIGICGSSTPAYKCGTLLVIHRIQDTDTQREYFSDILLEHTHTEACLKTSPIPVTRKSLSVNNSDTVFDMEGAGFHQAASVYLAPHQIHLLKTVSDHLEGEALNKQAVEGFIQSNINNIESYIDSAEALPHPFQLSIPNETMRLFIQLCDKFKFTATQQIQLKDAVLLAQLKTMQINNILEHYIQKTVTHKREMNALVENLIQALEA